MQLNLTPGRKGLREALGHVPSWISFTDREKVEVRLRRHPCRTVCLLRPAVRRLDTDCVHVQMVRVSGVCSSPRFGLSTCWNASALEL